MARICMPRSPHADPASTLFIVSSKTFTTQETLANATAARGWLTARLSPERGAQAFRRGQRRGRQGERLRHRAGECVRLLGLGRRPLFHVVGDRPADRRRAGLGGVRAAAGRRACDGPAFPEAPAERNIPLTMGLIALWNIDFLEADAYAVLPYAQDLARLPAYLQQLEMESNGKTTRRDGKPVKCADRPGAVRRARHQRPARLLSIDPPGHAARVLRFHPGGARPLRLSGPASPADRELPGAEPGPDVRQERRRGDGGNARRRR